MNYAPARPVRHQQHPGSVRRWWVLGVVVTAVFMVTLDNLVVTTALARIRGDLHASLTQLEWMVNAYTVTFAALMPAGAGLADRFGHRRMFVSGLLLFTGCSAAAALSPSAASLITARGLQGVGAAIVLPLSLTLLAEVFAAGRQRGLALGIWSGVSGLGVAVGPLVGGALVQTGSWQSIFWLNVPIGVVLVAVALMVLTKRPAVRRRVDVLGAALVTGALGGMVGGLVTSQHAPWTSVQVAGPLLAGAGLLAGFVWWEAHTPDPLLPLRLFGSPTFVTVNLVNLAMYFGMFGAIFLLAPYLQLVLGDSPWQAGVRILPWTLMPLIISPFAGVLIDRLGARSLVVSGMALQAAALGWIALIVDERVSGVALFGPCLVGGVGMSLVYPPIAGALLAAVPEADVAAGSAAMNSLRESGGAFGVAGLALVFTAAGGTADPGGYVAGLSPAVAVAAAVVAVGAVVALRLPKTAS